MKVDQLTFLGLALTLIALAGGQYLEGGGIKVLLNDAAGMIVVGGSLGAVMLQTPWRVFKHAIRALPWVFITPAIPFQQRLETLVEWSSVARREGLLGLEDAADTETDEFARRGLNLLVDGSEPDTIRSALLTELELHEQKLFDASRVYEAMGGYSPTMGIIGAVMGLIHVMGNLSDPDKLGDGIATAFVATVYGVALANLILLPIAHKLKYLATSQSRFREMILEGLVAIADGENPRIIETRLTPYLVVE